MARPAVRLGVIQMAFALGFLAVLARAAQVQLVRGARYAAQAEAQRTERVTLPARRGAIYDRRGVPLATSEESFHVGVAPNELKNPPNDARQIAARLGLSARDVERALRRKYAYFHGPFSASRVEPLRAIKGVHLDNEFVRFYPDPHMARPVLGRPASEGRPADGIERVLDTLLEGRSGSAVVLRDGQGRRFESPSRLDAFPVAGNDVYLTIDADLQDIVERALADAMEHYSAAGGDVVVLDPRTGEVLALASRAADGTMSSSAFTSPFEPGSTAKLFAVAALLTHGLVEPGDSVWGEHGKFRMGPRTITDDHVEGWMTLDDVIAQSSNIGIAKFSSRLSREQQFDMLRRFGVGASTGVEFPAESRGLLERPDRWSGVTGASLAMGYEMAVTPLQLATAYASIANDGVMLRPTLVREVRSPNGTVLYTAVAEPVRRVVSTEVAGRLREMLRRVVYEGGTGSTAALTSYEVAGKTGTARRAGSTGYVAGQYSASFASFFPAEHPQLVMVIKLDDPKGAYARLTAAPVTRSVLEQLLAAQSGSLDRGSLPGNASAPGPDPLLDAGSVPFVVSWPPAPPDTAVVQRAVPDVRGLTLRAAAQRLHQTGLQVKVQGWGQVQGSDPRAGSLVNPGSSVMITATDVVPAARPVPARSAPTRAVPRKPALARPMGRRAR
ncbi:MAG: PASTA domain-containing protein [Gemmatimonadetes bacterium]|nr:PASTA domain-containing protein [Gemmatimonadota bacterium]